MLHLHCPIGGVGLIFVLMLRSSYLLITPASVTRVYDNLHVSLINRNVAPFCASNLPYFLHAIIYVVCMFECNSIQLSLFRKQLHQKRTQWCYEYMVNLPAKYHICTH